MYTSREREAIERKWLKASIFSQRKRARRKAEKEFPGRQMGWFYGTLYFLDTRLEVYGAPRLPKPGGSEPPNGNPFGGVRIGRRGAFQFSIPRRRPNLDRRREQDW